eukprot:CFRG6413T1
MIQTISAGSLPCLPFPLPSQDKIYVADVPYYHDQNSIPKFSNANSESYKDDSDNMGVEEYNYDDEANDDDNSESQGTGGLYDWEIFLDPLEEPDHMLSTKKRSIPNLDLTPNWTDDVPPSEILCNLISEELGTVVDKNLKKNSCDGSQKRRASFSVSSPKKKLITQQTQSQRNSFDSNSTVCDEAKLIVTESRSSLPQLQSIHFPPFTSMYHNKTDYNINNNSIRNTYIKEHSYFPVRGNNYDGIDTGSPLPRKNTNRYIEVQQKQQFQSEGVVNNGTSVPTTPVFAAVTAGKISSGSMSGFPLPLDNKSSLHDKSSTRTSLLGGEVTSSPVNENVPVLSSNIQIDNRGQETREWSDQSLAPLTTLRAWGPSGHLSCPNSSYLQVRNHIPCNTQPKHLDSNIQISQPGMQYPLSQYQQCQFRQQHQGTHTNSAPPSALTNITKAEVKPSSRSVPSSVCGQIMHSGQKIDHKMRVFIDNMLSSAQPASPSKASQTIASPKKKINTTQLQKQPSREGRNLNVVSMGTEIIHLTSRSQHNASKWTIETLKHFFCRDFVQVCSNLSTSTYNFELETREKELLRFMTDMSVNSVIGDYSDNVNHADEYETPMSPDEGLTRLTEVGPVREPEVTYVVNTILTFVASRAGVQVIPERKFERRSARDAKNLPGCIIDYAITKNGVVLGLIECKSKREFKKDAFAHLVAELLVIQDRAGSPDIPIFGVLTDGFRWVFAVVKGTDLHLEHSENNDSVIKVRRAVMWKNLHEITEHMTSIVGQSTRALVEVIEQNPSE